MNATRHPDHLEVLRALSADREIRYAGIADKRAYAAGEPPGLVRPRQIVTSPNVPQPCGG